MRTLNYGSIGTDVELLRLALAGGYDLGAPAFESSSAGYKDRFILRYCRIAEM